MKTLMKSFIVVLFMIAIFASVLPLLVKASDVQSELDYDLEETHYTVILSNDLSEGHKELIAKSLLGIKVDTAEPYGIMCTLFGHKYEETTAEIITHKVRASAPRCSRERYRVQVCSRCDDIVYTLQSQTYISCCPVD